MEANVRGGVMVILGMVRLKKIDHAKTRWKLAWHESGLGLGIWMSLLITN